jgi:hypothetical protein
VTIYDVSNYDYDLSTYDLDYEVGASILASMYTRKIPYRDTPRRTEELRWPHVHDTRDRDLGSALGTALSMALVTNTLHAEQQYTYGSSNVVQQPRNGTSLKQG